MLVFTGYRQILNHGKEYFRKLPHIIANQITIYMMKIMESIGSYNGSYWKLIELCPVMKHHLI